MSKPMQKPIKDPEIADTVCGIRKLAHKHNYLAAHKNNNINKEDYFKLMKDTKKIANLVKILLEFDSIKNCFGYDSLMERYRSYLNIYYEMDVSYRKEWKDGSKKMLLVNALHETVMIGASVIKHIPVIYE